MAFSQSIDIIEGCLELDFLYNNCCPPLPLIPDYLRAIRVEGKPEEHQRFFELRVVFGDISSDSGHQLRNFE